MITPHLFVEPELLADWSFDLWPAESKIEFDDELLPVGAVMPSDVEEVIEIVKLAASAGRPMMVRGAGTNVVGSLEPLPSAVLIDMRGLNVIDPVNELNATVRVDAGVHGGELRDRLGEQGFALGHEPESLLVSTIGGWIATRSVGALATGYGGIASFIVSLDVVLPDGSTIAVGSRDQAGPALAELFVGSEGAFGIVTAATLRVRPLPEARRFRAFAVPSLLVGFGALRGLVQSGVAPTATRLLDERSSETFASERQIGEPGCLLFTVFEGSARLIECQERLTIERLIAVGGHDLGAQPAAEWDARRIGAERFTEGNDGDGHLMDWIDLFVPWDRLSDVISRGVAALDGAGVAAAVASSQVLSHGTDLCFELRIDAADDDEALDLDEAAWSAIMEIALTCGARIAHRHGHGRVRSRWIEQSFGASHATMKVIKEALDPLGIMNPGRLQL